VAGFVGRANVFRNGAARCFGAAEGEVAVVRPEWLEFASSGLPVVVRERRYTGPSAFFLVEGDATGRFEVEAHPAAARPGERAGVRATRMLTFPETAGNPV
jgi:hypothetical protein